LQNDQAGQFSKDETIYLLSLLLSRHRDSSLRQARLINSACARLLGVDRIPIPEIVDRILEPCVTRGRGNAAIVRAVARELRVELGTDAFRLGGVTLSGGAVFEQLRQMARYADRTLSTGARRDLVERLLPFVPEDGNLARHLRRGITSDLLEAMRLLLG